MKLVLYGATGQVGTELARVLPALGEFVAVPRSSVDFSDPVELQKYALDQRADVIVNAAAYTAVDKAEADADLAQLVNAEAPAALARAAETSGALLVHYSTDYVFDGRLDRPYREDDATGPLNVYGRTKLAGEQAIAASGARHLIFRTTWVQSGHGHNFARTILRMARERDSLRIVADQVGAPTVADLIAETTALAIPKYLDGAIDSGVFHLTASGATSWHELAVHIVSRARAADADVRVLPAAIEPVTTEQFAAAAARPKNSRLDCDRLERALGRRMPTWEEGVDRVLERLLEQGT